MGTLGRQVLNSMQMWKKTSSKMSYMDMKDRISSIEKDKSLRSVMVVLQG